MLASVSLLELALLCQWYLVRLVGSFVPVVVIYTAHVCCAHGLVVTHGHDGGARWASSASPFDDRPALRALDILTLDSCLFVAVHRQSRVKKKTAVCLKESTLVFFLPKLEHSVTRTLLRGFKSECLPGLMLILILFGE